MLRFFPVRRPRDAQTSCSPDPRKIQEMLEHFREHAMHAPPLVLERFMIVPQD